MSALPDLLIDPRRVYAQLGAAREHFTIEAIAECASTTTLLLARADAGAPAGSVVVASVSVTGIAAAATKDISLNVDGGFLS